MFLSIDGRARALTVAARLAGALTAPPPARLGDDRTSSGERRGGQSLAAGAAGIAVLHGLRAGAGASDWAAFHVWLKAAAREELSAGRGAGLWFGVPALAFTLSPSPQRLPVDLRRGG